MTSDTDIHDKLRAVFLAAIMVVSMAAVGATFAGSAAANTPTVDADDLSPSDDSAVLVGQELSVNVSEEDSVVEIREGTIGGDGDRVASSASDGDGVVTFSQDDTENLQDGEFYWLQVSNDEVNDSQFVAAEKDFDSEFDNDVVAESNLDNVNNLSVESDNWGDNPDIRPDDFNVTVASDQLDQDDLEDIFVDAVVTDDEEDFVVLPNANNTEFETEDLDDVLEVGEEYEFDVSSEGALAEVTATLEVVEDVDAELDFAEDTFTAANGDVAEIAFTAEGTDEVQLTIGEADDEFNATLNVTDIDELDEDDEEIVVNVNTFTLGNESDEEDIFTVENDGLDIEVASFSTVVDGGPEGQMLAEDRFRLDLQPEDPEGGFDRAGAERANFQIEERSTGDITTWTAGDVSGLEDADDVVEAVEDGDLIEADEVAEGDNLIVEIEATGLGGMFANVSDEDNNTLVDAIDEGYVDLTFEEQDTPRNVDGVNFQYNDTDSSVTTIEGDGVHYAVLEVDDDEFEDAFDRDGAIETEFSVIAVDGVSTSQYALVAPDEDGEFEDETADTEWAPVDAEIDFNWDDEAEDQFQVLNEEGQEISGTTTVAPGAEFSFLADGPTITSDTATVEVDDGELVWSAELDFSGAADGDLYNLEYEEDADEPRFDDEEEDAIVVMEEDVDDANFDIVDVTPGEDMTVEPGQELAVDVEVENTGDVEDTQEVVFNFDGEELLSEELTLEGGESDTVTFEADAPEDEGDYEWFVATDDDESATWTLTVEEEVDEDPANFDIVDVTPGEDMTVEPGDALTVDVDVENTGDETGTQDVEFVFDGDVLTSEELTLDGDEEGSVSFDVDAPADEGSYDWSVQTEDDESATWTLTVETEEVDEDDEDDEVDEEDDEDDEDDDADDDGAGFGVIVAALALLGAALLAIRRQVQFE